MSLLPGRSLVNSNRTARFIFLGGGGRGGREVNDPHPLSTVRRPVPVNSSVFLSRRVPHKHQGGSESSVPCTRVGPPNPDDSTMSRAAPPWIKDRPQANLSSILKPRGSENRSCSRVPSSPLSHTSRVLAAPRDPPYQLFALPTPLPAISEAWPSSEL